MVVAMMLVTIMIAIVVVVVIPRSGSQVGKKVFMNYRLFQLCLLTVRLSCLPLLPGPCQQGRPGVCVCVCVCSCVYVCLCVCVCVCVCVLVCE
jgi:hypothetical protein